MHRATPANSSFRAYVAGGSRSCVGQVDDAQFMQEMAGRFMANEERQAIESPQNYGFTSVVADAAKDAMGKIQQCAETFIGFMGGNRSFPVAGNMDDRRHRLFNLSKDAAKGASAMYGLREWGQQFLISNDGMYMTGNAGQQQQQSGSGGGTRDTSGGGSSGQQQGYKIKLQLVDNQNAQQQSGGSGGSGGGAQLVGKQIGWLGAARRFFTSKSGVEFEYDVVVPRDGSAGGTSATGGQTQQGMGQKTLHKEQSTTYSEMTNQHIQHTRGNGNVLVQDSAVTTHYQDPSKSTKADSGHVHIRYGSAAIFTDSLGCWSSQPIGLKADSCSTSASTSAAALEDAPVRGFMTIAPTLDEAMSMFAEFRELQERVRLLADRVAEFEARQS